MQPMPFSSRGLTLIETLVVLVIASVMATLVTLRLGVFDQTASLRDHLSDVAQAVDAVCEQALFRARPQSVSFYAHGLIWNGVDNSALVTWPTEIRAAVRIEGHATPLQKNPLSASAGAREGVGDFEGMPFHILCDPLGQRTAFELQLQDNAHSATLIMAGDGQWSIQSEDQS